MRVERSTTDRGRDGGRFAWGLWGGLALAAVGLVAVAVGWTKAAGTPDVRVQLQALISGGLGGLAAILAGGFLVLSDLTDAGFRRLEAQLDRVTGAVLDLAGHAPGEAPGGWQPEDGSDAGPSMVVEASHASYHQPGCDVLDGRDGVRSITVAQARGEGLSPCPVCLGEQVA